MDVLRRHPQQDLTGAAQLTKLLKDEPNHLLQSAIGIEAETDLTIPGVAAG
jgi:hypothetical protein